MQRGAGGDYKIMMAPRNEDLCGISDSHMETVKFATTI
jgi:hypothetical protein